MSEVKEINKLKSYLWNSSHLAEKFRNKSVCDPSNVTSHPTYFDNRGVGGGGGGICNTLIKVKFSQSY